VTRPAASWNVVTPLLSVWALPVTRPARSWKMLCCALAGAGEHEQQKRDADQRRNFPRATVTIEDVPAAIATRPDDDAHSPRAPAQGAWVSMRAFSSGRR